MDVYFGPVNAHASNKEMAIMNMQKSFNLVDLRFQKSVIYMTDMKFLESAKIS